MSTGTQARQPAGVPVGGQFATTARAETGVSLPTAPDDADATSAAVARSIADAVIAAEPGARYLELYTVEHGTANRVFAGAVLDSDGELLHEDVDGIRTPGDPDPWAVHSAVLQLTGRYQSIEHAARCPAVSDPRDRQDPALSSSTRFVLDLWAARALHLKGSTT